MYFLLLNFWILCVCVCVFSHLQEYVHVCVCGCPNMMASSILQFVYWVALHNVFHWTRNSLTSAILARMLGDSPFLPSECWASSVPVPHLWGCRRSEFQPSSLGWGQMLYPVNNCSNSCDVCLEVNTLEKEAVYILRLYWKLQVTLAESLFDQDSSVYWEVRYIFYGNVV